MKHLLLSLSCLGLVLIAGLAPMLAFAEDPVFIPTPDAPFWQALVALIGGIKGASLLAGAMLVCQVALALSQSVLGTFEGKYQYLAVCFFSLVIAIVGAIASGQPFAAALISGPAMAAFQVFGHQFYKQFLEKTASAVKLLAFVLVPLSLLGIGACVSTGPVKPSCATLDAVTSSVAVGLSQPFLLDCTYPEVILRALDAQAADWGLCSAAPKLAAQSPSSRQSVMLPNGEQRMQGVIGAFICPELSAWVTKHLVGGSTLLTEADCKGTGVSNLAQVACSFIPF